MEDCLHTSSENLSKLVSWAHSHGTICSLIPNLKHLLTEGAHGNLTAMWGCSAGHAYHWPLTATCKTGPKDRVCYQDSRSLGSDSLSLQAPGIPGDRFLARASKGKGPDCGQTRDSCDFSNCSEPSEVDDNTEDYNSNLFDIVCESSATDEDGDYELQNVPRTAPRKRGVPGTAQGDQWRQRTDETPGDPAVKKIKQEVPEDYYTVANTQLSGGMDLGPMSPSPKQATHRLPPLQTALVNKPSPIEGADLPAPSPSPSGKSTPSMAKPHRAPPPVAQGGPQLPGHSELADPMSGDGVGKPGGAPLPLRDTDDSPAGVSSDLEIVPAQTLGSDPKAEGSVPPSVIEIERLKGLLQAERSRSESMGETINSLKQDKELLQQELTKKAELICEFLQEQLTTRPEKRRAQSYNQPEASGSRQRVPMYSDESTTFESPALFDSFDEIDVNQNERAKMVKIPKRNREGENTRVRMKNVVGVIARYMTALQEFRRSVSMKVAFDRVGVDRNTISRTAAIAELSLAAPEVFHSLPPWDEKEETLAHYSFRCRQAMDDTIKAKIKAMKAKGELLPIVSK